MKLIHIYNRAEGELPEPAMLRLGRNKHRKGSNGFYVDLTLPFINANRSCVDINKWTLVHDVPCMLRLSLLVRRLRNEGRLRWSFARTWVAQERTSDFSTGYMPEEYIGLGWKVEKP